MRDDESCRPGPATTKTGVPSFAASPVTAITTIGRRTGTAARSLAAVRQSQRARENCHRPRQRHRPRRRQRHLPMSTPTKGN